MGTSASPVERLRAFYHNIGEGNFKALGQFLILTAIYVQPQYMMYPTMLMGRLVIVDEYKRWGRRFRGLIIDRLDIAERPDLVRGPQAHPNEAYCFKATYLLVGRHVEAIPDLRGVQLMADGKIKQLAVTDHVWLGANYGIMRIQSMFTVIHHG